MHGRVLKSSKIQRQVGNHGAQPLERQRANIMVGAELFPGDDNMLDRAVFDRDFLNGRAQTQVGLADALPCFASSESSAERRRPGTPISYEFFRARKPRRKT